MTTGILDLVELQPEECGVATSVEGLSLEPISCRAGVGVGFSGRCEERELRPSPRGKLRRLSAGDSVGQRDCAARIRTEVGVLLKVGEHLRNFLDRLTRFCLGQN